MRSCFEGALPRTRLTPSRVVVQAHEVDDGAVVVAGVAHGPPLGEVVGHGIPSTTLLTGTQTYLHRPGTPAAS